MKFRFNETITQISERILEQRIQKSEKYIAQVQAVMQSKDFNEPESSVNLPFDDNIINSVKELSHKLVSQSLKYFVIIGIGGSNLGSKAIYEALLGFQDSLQPNIDRAKILFIDTNNSRLITEFIKLIDSINSPDEIIVNVITKSGGTTEVIANAEIVISKLIEKSDDFKKRVVFTTTFEGHLWNYAIENGYECLVHQNVGGRYSVMSAVGLFPLYSVGVNVDKLLEGAKQSLIDNSTNNRDNNSLVSAILLSENLKRGKTINDNFIFNGELESLGKWYRQLMGESIGKQQDIHDNDVFRGITPIVSIGSTDLHSMGQLYLGGPKDKYTTFISGKTDKDIIISDNRVFEGIVEDISGKRFNDIGFAILKGTQAAYINQNLPFSEIILEGINEYELGYFMQFKMLEMMYLANLLEVNAFDQPNVELYKIETKKILSQ